MKKISLKWRLFIYLLGFTVILLILLWYFQIVHLSSFYKSIKTFELNKASNELLAELDSENLANVIQSVADEYDISINLVNSQAESVYSSNLMNSAHIYIFGSKEYDELYNRAKEAGGKVTFEVDGRYRNMGMSGGYNGEMQTAGDSMPTGEMPTGEMPADDTSGGEGPTLPSFDGLIPGESRSYSGDMRIWGDNNSQTTLVFAGIVTSTDGDEYLLLMSSLITPVDATVVTLQRQFIYISIIFIVLGLGLAFVISLLVSRPIIKINNSAKRLAEGEFDTKFSGKGFKEVEELSETLNYAAEELGRTENLRKDLIANVSHDLRTPLTMITAYAEAMRDIPGENNPENTQVIIDEANRLTNLVNDLLDLSKLQAGVMVLNAEVFDFTTKITEVMHRFTKLAGQQGYNVSFEYRENVRVYADEYKIYQVVYNLINNAINYAGDDKTVIVRQIVHGNIVRLEVIDHGKGIAPGEQKNIWDRYYKIDKTHKRATSGTGLGLSIVNNILKLHDAKYGVKSAPGKGSTFWFELKIYEEGNEETITE